MSKKKVFDLSKLTKPDNQFLIKEKIETTAIQESEKKKIVRKKAEKVGRPIIGNEPLNKKITINFTENEIEKLIGKAGIIPVSPYIRDVLKKAGII